MLSFLKSIVLIALIISSNFELMAQLPSDMTDGGIKVALPLPAAAITTEMKTFSFSGTLTTSDPTKNERLNRNGVVSSCTSPKSCNIFASGAFRFDQYTFTNPDSKNMVCIDVLLKGTCTEGNIDVTVYDGSFDPGNICSNFIADPGLSSGIPANDLALSFNLAPSQTVVLVVSSPNTNSTCQSGGGYTLQLSGVFAIENVPTLSQWGIISLSLILLIISIVSIKSIIISKSFLKH